MKKFEYMFEPQEERKKFNNRIEFWNYLGQQGWELMPDVGINNEFVFKREITDEPSIQRTTRREFEYSRA